jgi:hypothetical protein
MVFENRALRRIFGTKRDEVTGGWNKLHYGRLHNLFSRPSIIRINVKEDEIDRVCSTNLPNMNIYIGYWCERQKERDHLEDRDVGGLIILKPILEV